MSHEPPVRVTCVRIASYAGALTYGASYAVLEQDDTGARLKLRIRDDHGCARWYPRDCFDLEGRPAAQIVEVRLEDSLDHTDTAAVSVEVRFSDGARRWCSFALPEALARFGDTLPGTAVRIHTGANLIILTELTAATIRLALRTLLEQGQLHAHTLAVAGDAEAS
jgi:hypothetical protein